MNTGVLSHKLVNYTHLGVSVGFYLRYIPVHTFILPTPSSPFYRIDGPSTREGTYFYKQVNLLKQSQAVTHAVWKKSLHTNPG